MADYKGSGAPPSYPEQYPEQFPPQQQQSYANDPIQNAAPPHSQMIHHDSTFSQQEKAHHANGGPPQGHAPAPQGQDAQQQQMAAQGYQTAMPIGSLGAGAAPIDCPACNMRQMTRIEYKSGGTTWAWAAGVCICLGCGCIPFCINSTKDVQHFCGHCGTRVATWHRSGHTEVHLHR